MSFLNIFDHINDSVARVKHITAFVEEDTLRLVLICLIVGFSAATGVVLFMILLRRTISINHTIRKKKLVEKYENFLAESITYFYENDKIFEKKAFSVTLNKNDQRRAFNRKVLLEQVLLMKKHVGGEEAWVLFDLYERLGFNKTAIKNLKSWHWYTRLQALQELIAMESKSANTLFQKMTGDSNSYVRIAAIKALILRGGYLQNGQAAWQPSLIRYSYDLSAWEQSQIFDALSHHQDIQLPNFSPLLYSFNPTVVLFGLRMIKYFHCMDAVPQVIPFLQSANPAIVKACEDVIKQFQQEYEKEETAAEDTLVLSDNPQVLDLNAFDLKEKEPSPLVNFKELRDMMSEKPTNQKTDKEKMMSISDLNSLEIPIHTPIKEGISMGAGIRLQTKTTRTPKKLKELQLNFQISIASINQDNTLMPLIETQANTKEDICGKTAALLQNISEGLEINADDVILHYGDSPFNQATFLSALYEIPNLVNIVPLKHKSKIWKQALNESKKPNGGAPKIYGKSLYLTEKTELKSYTRKGINYTNELSSIYETLPDERKEMIINSPKGQPLKVEICRWNNLLKRGKKAYSMKDKPFDVVAIRIYDAKTGELLSKHPTFLCVFGKNKNKVSLEKLPQDNPQYFAVEHTKNTVVKPLKREPTPSVIYQFSEHENLEKA
jgi:hypothetical protein